MSAAYDFLTPDFKSQPYWWDAYPRPAQSTTPLPAQTDVLIVGSGYTGLNCALQTARAGRETLIIDAEAAGWGCSSRNGGQISGEIKPGFHELRKKYGSETAKNLINEARNALLWLGDFIDDEQLDCQFKRCGRFEAAHNPRQFRALAKAATNQTPGLEREMEVVSRDQQSTEIDSPYYHGGLLIWDHCSLDPASYHRVLQQKVEAAGGTVVSFCKALEITKCQTGYRVVTSQGEVVANEVVIATNGYSGSLMPWLQRRIVPIGSYMLATEELDKELIDGLIPNDRVFSDTRRLVVYFRRSPDGKRILFGGRVSVFESDPYQCLPALRQELLRVFPQLSDARISHSWMGFVGYTFDFMPHIGSHNGIHYAMGYCGSGICLASFLGNRLGRKLAGEQGEQTVFEQPRFQTRPLYHGKPWFLASAVRYYQLLDRFT